MHLSDSNRPYYSGLDGLRGLAILMVISYHNFSFVKIFNFGWVGVDLFFVLSGFLITDILLNTLNSPNFLRSFFVKRILRIFPLYYLYLLFFLIILPQLDLLTNDLKYFVEHQSWMWTYTQNWLFSFCLKDNAHLLTHLWSLAVEVQYYLIWPFVILSVRKPKYLFLLILLILISINLFRWTIWIWNLKDFNYHAFYTFSRIDGILIGSMICILRKTKPQFLSNNIVTIFLYLVLINFTFYTFNILNNNIFPYYASVGYFTISLLFGLLLNQVLEGNSTLLLKALSVKPLKFIGKISYGFYVFHWPIYLLLSPSISKKIEFIYPISEGRNQLTVSLLATLIGLFISTFSYYFFEIRILKLKRYIQIRI